MRPHLRIRFFAVILLALSALTAAADQAAKDKILQWISFPDDRFQVRGLPWFQRNRPELWRLPGSSKDAVPTGVWNRAIAPDGGRICFKSGTSRLAVKVQAPHKPAKRCFFDAFVDGQLAGSAQVTGTNEMELQLFENADPKDKQVVIYLPNNSEIRLLAIGIDSSASAKPVASFAMEKPLVCYGSSVLQGTGSHHPSSTYPAALARHLNMDFVNLGFGGAGKAEPAVVQLVNELDASCYLFDLGKSYGDQGIEPYAKMLETIRRAHPRVPIICVTPIYSTKEKTEPGYLAKSENLRKLMRTAAANLKNGGDTNIHVVEGLDLFGAADERLFSDPLHPNDAGNELMATRLTPVVRRLLFSGR